ncbi:MAG: hypothetical protein KJ592_01725 [Nanoarchaeota archaeon]|nr:hypothetical protein [Nanoarchaeota archaeon]
MKSASGLAILTLLFWATIFINVFIDIEAGRGSDVARLALFGIIFYAIISIPAVFLIGALIGLIIQKIKNKK